MSRSNPPDADVRPALSRDWTLDALLQIAALRRPTEIALVDAPNRRAFGDGTPRYVSYAAADRMVDAVAGRLRGLGLPRGAVIALQLPNMVEGTLALLGVLRAGMVAAPLPLLWRRADAVEVLRRIGAKAIIAGGRIAGDDLCELALHVAAEVFTIRYVCGFGEKLPDGAIGLDDLFTADGLDPAPKSLRGGSGNELAVLTWETTPHGRMVVARSHRHLLAGAIPLMLEGALRQDARIIATISQDCFAGLALGVVPWLISGGTLVLHHAFDAQSFAQQLAEHDCDTAVVPGPLTSSFAAAGLLNHPGLVTVFAVWRSPERMAAGVAGAQGAPNDRAHPILVDVPVFGEIGLVAVRRDGSGEPAPLRGSEFLAVARSRNGSLMLRGPMVPRQPYPSHRAQRDAPVLVTDSAGFVDTGYPCRAEGEALSITGAPAGIVTVGGYRFVQRRLQDELGAAGQDASLAPLPHAYLNHRLAGSAADRAAIRAALSAQGANALVAGAFRPERRPKAA